MVTLANTAHYAQHIYDLHRLRQLLTLGNEIAERACAGQPEQGVDTFLEEIDQRFTEISAGKVTTSGLRALSDIRNETLADWEEQSKSDGPVGLMTGLRDLDRVLRGIGSTDLVLLAGRPSMGKTALAMTIARNVARRINPERRGAVAFFSMEMGDNQLDGRLMSMETGIQGPRARRLTTADFERLLGANPNLPLWIDDTGGATISHLRRECLRLQRRKGLTCVIVDYLQLMKVERALGINNRVHEVGYLSRGLKTLAKELKVPVIALSQLSRQVEQREDKRPQLSDLRDSGEIEQDADIVMFTYRHEYYLERSDSEPRRAPHQNPDQFTALYNAWNSRMAEHRGKAEVIVSKHRHDRTGIAHLQFDADRTMFNDPTPEPPAGHPAAFSYGDR